MVVDAPMQFADCNCSTVVRYKSEMRKRLSPGCTTYARTHEGGGPHTMGGAVAAMGGTNIILPVCSS